MDNTVEQESYGLEEIHKLLLQVLDELDRICRENDIQYSLHGGALLGAERNGKLIPWDNDVDVCMTRENYKKFYKIVSNIQSDYQINEQVLWVPRFVYFKDNQLAYIDIFIWDYISEKKWQQFLKINLLRLLQGMMKPSLQCKRKYKIFTMKEKIFLSFTYYFGRLFSHNFKAKIYYYLSEKCFLGQKKYIHKSNDNFSGIVCFFDSEYMSEYAEIILEEKQYMVSKRYKEFLIRTYGKNYLIPPPYQSRMSVHDNLLEELKSKLLES